MTPTARYLAIPALALAASCTTPPPERAATPVGPAPAAPTAAAPAPAAPHAAPVLAQAGVTAYVITLAESASAPERTAATELATYLKQVTGVEFAVVAPPAAAGRPVIAVGPGAAKGVASLTETLDKAADGAYRTYDLGVHDLKAGMYFWAAPMGKADEVDSVFVDRLFCVREKALRKR